MAKKASVTKNTKAKPNDSSNKRKKIITIIVAIIIIIILLLSLTCCQKQNDTNKLKGKVIKETKKEKNKKKKTKEQEPSKTYTRNIPTRYNESSSLTPVVPTSLSYNPTASNETAEEKDTDAPIARVIYSNTEPTNEDVVVTIIATEKVQEVQGFELSSDGKTLTKTVSENEEAEVTIKDLAGNETTVSYSVTNIDKDAPTARVSYSNTDSTNEDVVVTITASEEVEEVQGFELSSDGKTLTKTVSENEEAEVTIKDLAGNETTVSYSVTNIDKVAPTAEVTYSNTDPTNEDVVVTITASEKVEGVQGFELSSDGKTLTKTVSENEEAEVTITDLVGNETTVSYSVTNIDKDAPTARVSYNTTNPTNEDVVITITTSEEVQELQGFELASDGKTLTKTVSENEEAEVTIKDLAGNETTVRYSVTNIDKDAPTARVSYENIYSLGFILTGKKVTVTANEKIQAVSGWTLSSDSKTLTKNLTLIVDSPSGSITIKDLAGNETSVPYDALFQ